MTFQFIERDPKFEQKARPSHFFKCKGIKGQRVKIEKRYMFCNIGLKKSGGAELLSEQAEFKGSLVIRDEEETSKPQESSESDILTRRSEEGIRRILTSLQVVILPTQYLRGQAGEIAS
jgi:hypothetical protein